jgi:hypothetical protein
MLEFVTAASSAGSNSRFQEANEPPRPTVHVVRASEAVNA